MPESTILVTNKANTRVGEYDKLTTWLLLGETNTNQAEVSIQISDVQPGGLQGLHRHPQVQCYYVIQGQGEVFVNGVSKAVQAGDAILIPSDAEHGIRNTGSQLLQYLTANKSFGRAAESQTWNQQPI